MSDVEVGPNIFQPGVLQSRLGPTCVAGAEAGALEGWVVGVQRRTGDAERCVR